MEIEHFQTDDSSCSASPCDHDVLYHPVWICFEVFWSIQRVVDQVGLHQGVDAAAERIALRQLRLRARSIVALVVAPEFPVGDWFAALDRLLQGAPATFEDRPVVVDLSAVQAKSGPEGVGIVLDGLEARDLKLVGALGVEAKVLAAARWERLATRLLGRDMALDNLASRHAAEEKSLELVAPEPITLEPIPPEPVTPAEPPPSTLLIERPVRSGESIVFPGGDVTIVGSVGSGAEVLAGGSIHVYGALRGRAMAGLKTGAAARIFCRRLEAELVAIDRLYRTSEHWGEALHGRAVHVFCDRGTLRLTALD
jgi:septum site-determining protein MinC